MLVLRADGPNSVWQEVSLDLRAYAGQTVAVTFLAHTDDEVPTLFIVDDVSLAVCYVPEPLACYLPVVMQ
jgi:hypothetical protein